MKRFLPIVLGLAVLASGPPAAVATGARAAGAPATQTAGAPDPDDRLFAAPTRLDHIGRIVAPVMINGQGPFRFVVDTGANHSTISPQLARRLGLAPAKGASMRVTGITGTEALPWVRIEELEVGHFVIRSQRMPVIETRVMAGADGILGMAGLNAGRIAVDFRRNTVWISRSHGGPIWDFLKIPAQLTRGGLLMVPARIAGIPVEAIIDTGSPHTLGNMALHQALLRRLSKSAVAKIYGVTNEVSSGDYAAAPDIALGPATIRSLSIVYSGISIFKVWHLQAKPAVVIGMDVLGTVDVLVLDFAHPNLYMLPVEPQGVEVIRRMS